MHLIPIIFAEWTFRYVVVDGTYVTASGLQLTNPKKVANVHTMMGFMRDDGDPFISLPVGFFPTPHRIIMLIT